MHDLACYYMSSFRSSNFTMSQQGPRSEFILCTGFYCGVFNEYYIIMMYAINIYFCYKGLTCNFPALYSLIWQKKKKKKAWAFTLSSLGDSPAGLFYWQICKLCFINSLSIVTSQKFYLGKCGNM